MAAHKHADLIMQYAQDAAETDKPWERWDIYDCVNDKWLPMRDSESFMQQASYRRKSQKKAVDLSVLVSSQIDCEFRTGTKSAIGVLTGFIGAKADKFIQLDKVCDIEWQECRPRLNHWHSWQGGDCPLPEGLAVEVMFRLGQTTNHRYMDGRWSHVDSGGDIIAFKVTGLADGWTWPWEVE